MIKQSDVTIVIPHLGATDEQSRSLKECLNSLLETTTDCQIIIATNGKKMAHLGLNELNPVYDRVKRIHVEEQGQCKAVNAAIATVNTSMVMVTNDDMIYPSGWFEALTDVQTPEGVIACISPVLVEPQGGAPTFEVHFCGGAGGDFNKAKFLEYAKNRKAPLEKLRTGFNLPFLIDRDLWNLVGGYDVAYDPWSSNSDSDFEYKLILAGIQPYQNTKAVVYHFSQTSGTFLPENRPFWEKNWNYFINKWGFPRTDDGIWEASFEIPKENKFHPFWEGFFINSPLRIHNSTDPYLE